MNTRLRWLLLIAVLVVGLVAVFQRRADVELSAWLVRHLSSRSDQRTAGALDMLRARGWQTDAALRGLDLSLANFEENDLSGFDFSGANFYKANLYHATARAVVLRDANLQQAALHDADLQDADLRGADLRDAYLTGANLEGANLEGAQFSVYTLLPSYTYWTPDTDMAMFTDPAHPQFWRSADERSPAYSLQATPEPPAAGTSQPTPTAG